MAQTSRSQVTVTLGRSGPVVKKAFALDNGLSDLVPLPDVGTKRPVKDRIGRKIDVSVFHEDQPNNKRLRGDDNKHECVLNDMPHMVKDDLRFKLMQKQKINRTENDDHHDGVDLREKLSGKLQAPVSRFNMQHRIPERKDTSFLVPVHPSQNGGDSLRYEPLKYSYSAWNVELRQRSPERVVNTSRGLSPLHRNREQFQKRALGRSFDDVRLVSRRRSPERFLSKSRGFSPLHRNREEFPKRALVRPFDDTRLVPGQRTPERILNYTRGISPPHWNREELQKRALGRPSHDVRLIPRHRSPERFLITSRGRFPTQGNAEQFQNRALVRSLDDVKSVPYTTKDVYSIRSIVAAPSMEKSTIPTGSVKPIEPVRTPGPPSGSVLQNSSCMGGEQPTLDSLLNSLGLGKYAILFKAEEVDMAALRQMRDHDLKELGIPMGPRKKILLAVAPYSKRHPR